MSGRLYVVLDNFARESPIRTWTGYPDKAA